VRPSAASGSGPHRSGPLTFILLADPTIFAFIVPSFLTTPVLSPLFLAFISLAAERMLLIHHHHHNHDWQNKPSLEDSSRFVLNQTIRFLLLWISQQ
jgi:hypothetical protein